MANLTLRYLDELSFVLNNRRHLSSQAKASSVGDLLSEEERFDTWITPEECAVYSREQRPPLVIPRITQYRGQRQDRYVPQHGVMAQSYPEDTLQDPSSIKSSVEQYEGSHQWSPASERGYDMGQFSKPSSFSPRVLVRHRFAGSTENLLRPNRPNLPASSSGDSLDLEFRERGAPRPRERKSRSMVSTKERKRSPVPAPRIPPPIIETPTFQTTIVQEGPIKRTKFSVHTKKCKKNWTDCYMILTQTALTFFKDQKTYLSYQNSKLQKPGMQASPTMSPPELVLRLQNAHVQPCTARYTRRYNKSLLLTIDHDQYLLQDETEDGTKRWLSLIQSIIFKLGPPKLSEYPMSYSSKTPINSSNTDIESIGLTPPAVRSALRIKQKAGGSSNEDSSDSTELSVQRSDVKSRLKKLFAKRPPMDALVKKGIYQDPLVFGRKLDEVCPAKSPRVPEFVVACVREIEKSEENLCTDGLYRASGNLSQVQKIRLEVDQRNMSVIESNPDVHVLTGSLKLFFRELKEPLIPFNMFLRVLSACSLKPREARVKEFRDIVNDLHDCNRDTLKFLLEHLLRVTKYSERNRMTTANLAIVFGPTLMWAPPSEAHNIAVDCIQQNNVVDILLTDFKEIFGDENLSNRKA